MTVEEALAAARRARDNMRAAWQTERDAEAAVLKAREARKNAEEIFDRANESLGAAIETENAA